MCLVFQKSGNSTSSHKESFLLYSTLITMFELLILFTVSNAVAQFLQATPIQSCSTAAENHIETMRKLFCGTATKLANYYLQVVVLINEKII